MKRLTTDAPKNNLESALNMFYAKDGEALVLCGGSEPNYVDVTLFDYIRSTILNVLGPSMSNLSDDELSEVLSEIWLFDGNSTVEGLIATLYTAAWAFAELRERLKMYEDREQEERRWIPVTERMPDEHESLFARYKDTDKWFDGMFMTISDLVIVCVEYENGERMVKTANATEGIWKVKDSLYPCRVTHWMQIPEPPKEGK